ncbi:ABC transporter permease [Larkinella soli]|uniref:ABC transporter permease n=1 Tax=Larkinella soli TaxID=1770527 RepID=UPI000FFC0F2B|nr:ABC transporter permease [Larkinella soli]
MLIHYLTLALRNLRQNRATSAISILGLAVGLAGGLTIFLVVHYFFSFDRYHPHMDRSFWIVTDIRQERVMPTDAAPRPLADVLRREYPFVESAVRLETFFGRTISVPDGRGGWSGKFGEARNLCFTEPQYFDLFGVEWVRGDPKTALAAPNTIVLSERYALKYFNTAEALGRRLRLDNRTDLTVTGIMRNPPANTQLRYDALISYATIPVLEGKEALQDWTGLQAMCFVLLREGAGRQELNRVLPAIRRKYYAPKDIAHFGFEVLPLEDLMHERSGTAPRPILYALIGVGILLVMAACINFVNLATARALKRFREIGVRKVVGSTRGQLIGQFLLETALLTLLAVLVALALTQSVLPAVNRILASQIEMLDPRISILDLFQSRALFWFLGLIVGVVLLAGLYPALVQSGFNPTTALKGKPTSRPGAGLLVRKGLIIGQFFLAQLFVMGVLVITVQLRHMQSVEWGFRQDARLVVWLPREGGVDPDRLRARWLAVKGVEQVTFGSDLPATPYNRPSPFSFHTATEPESFDTRVRAADEQYLPAFGLPLVAGRNFSTGDTTAQEVIVNEALVRQLGLSSPGAVLGRRMRVKEADRIIVGVVKDFRSGDLHQPVLPVTLIHDLAHCQVAVLSLRSTDSATLKAVEHVWDRLLPEQVYRAKPVDELLRSFTDIERLLAGFVQVFALLAVGMSCLGLYGLVTFLAETRSKEIGVRRVLGARTSQLLWLFGREFGLLLGLGFLAAVPPGWWLMSIWLAQYAHRIPISGWMFAGTLGLTLLLTGLTVFRQALKAVLTNPIHYLKNE